MAAIPVHIRWLIRIDMPRVLQIEAACFEQAWELEDFLRALRHRNCIGMVAGDRDHIAGFMLYELWKAKMEILNFAVAPEYQRKKVGQQMIDKVYAKLSMHRRRSVGCMVRESNLGAQMFFKAQGMQALRVERGCYTDTGEDGYRFAVTLAELQAFGRVPSVEHA